MSARYVTQLYNVFSTVPVPDTRRIEWDRKTLWISCTRTLLFSTFSHHQVDRLRVRQICGAAVLPRIGGPDRVEEEAGPGLAAKPLRLKGEAGPLAGGQGRPLPLPAEVGGHRPVYCCQHAVQSCQGTPIRSIA